MTQNPNTNNSSNSAYDLGSPTRVWILTQTQGTWKVPKILSHWCGYMFVAF
jgi:hypothetical protein